MVTLPIDIISNEIFPRLPGKSLVRFKCVSKYYNAFISSPHFSRLHRRHSRSSDADRLLILGGRNDTNLYSSDIDSPHPDVATTIPLPHALNDDSLYRKISILASLDGILCVGLSLKMGYPDDFKLVLINPTTRLYLEMPSPCAPDGRVYLGGGWGDFRVKFGFGYDHVNDDYKLVRVSQSGTVFDDYYHGHELVYREVMVYSLNLNEWKLVENVDKPYDSLSMNQGGVLMYDCLLHWLFWGNDDVYRVYCFDVRSDRWTDNVPLMDLFTDRMAEFNEEDKDKVVHVHDMGVLYGCLCLTTVTNLSKVIWIMKEYGVKESWVKLFDVARCFGTGPYYYIHYPLGFRQGRKHEVLVRKEGRFGLFWCDIDNGSESYGRIEKLKYVPVFGDSCFFKGSLVTIPGGEKIIA